jgi:TIR domain-containing protein
MTDASDNRRDFFISCNKADVAWAEWVGAVLEHAGYKVLLDIRGFKGNLVAHMHDAHSRAERTLALLSDNYFASDFTLGEWTARGRTAPSYSRIWWLGLEAAYPR